jgi:TFIIF-interacting CTD phosphatase-like protein
MVKKNVFLDLDNTLISAEAIEDFPFETPGLREKALKFNLHNMDDYYIVFERPHLQEFLDELFKKYNVSIWTAATKDYALYIIDKIILKKPGRKLNYVFFKYHGDISRKKYKNLKGGDPKNLKLLWEEFQLPGIREDNTIIVDDYSDVTDVQRKNSIRIKEFNILDSRSEYDKELDGMVDRIEEKLEKLSHK